MLQGDRTTVVTDDPRMLTVSPVRVHAATRDGDRQRIARGDRGREDRATGARWDAPGWGGVIETDTRPVWARSGSPIGVGGILTTVAWLSRW